MNLRLLQISDSALPIGGYTHSWGLESALARRLVHDAATLERWARAWLRHALAPLEGVVAAAVCRAAGAEDWPTVCRANELLTAAIAPPSIRNASAEMGDQLLALAATWEWSALGVKAFRTACPAAIRWNHAVVFGLLGALTGASPNTTLTAYLHQAVLAMISAGVRAVPVNHTHGQQILAYLHGNIEEMAGRFAAAELEEAGSGCPFYEVLCDEQTRLDTRLFRS
jgi:urease accessory protein